MQLAMSPDSLLLFCSVAASAAAAFALVSLYRHLAHRRAQASSDDGLVALAAAGGDGSEDELLPLSAAAAGLPAFMYNRLVRHSGKGAGSTECAVCLGELQRGEVVKQLPACAHLFHDGCIDAWLRSHVTCPVCRSLVDASPPVAAGVVLRRTE